MASNTSNISNSMDDSFELPANSYNPSRVASSDEPLEQLLDRAMAENPSRGAPVVDTTPRRQPAPRRPKAETDAPAPSQEKPRRKAEPAKDIRPLEEGESLGFIGTVVRFFADGRWRTFVGVAFFLAAVYMLVASISYLSAGTADQSVVENHSAAEIAASPDKVTNTAGWFGALLSHMLIYRWLGVGGFVIIAYFTCIALTLLHLRRFKFWSLTFKSLLSAIAISDIAGFFTYRTALPMFWGGEHGYFINDILYGATSVVGAGLFAILMGVVLLLIFAAPIRHLAIEAHDFWRRHIDKLSTRYQQSMATARAAIERERASRRAAEQAKKTEPEEPETCEKSEEVRPTPQPRPKPEPKPEPQPEPEPKTQVNLVDIDTPAAAPSVPVVEYIPSPAAVQEPAAEMPPVDIVENTPIEEADDIDIDAYDPTAELARFRFPSIELLTERQTSFTLSEEEQEENNQTIINTLNSYGIEIESIKASVGPTITLYEIVPAKGVRVAKIKRLGDDMTLSLHATGIRIIAPMPGKGTIGMEVPNKHPQAVSIRSILSSKAYHESTAELPLALGTTITNDVYVTDLAKMPHLLVAGATGMGKSVGLNTIIASLLYKKHPAELKFVLVDPKMVEFSLYRTLERHYLAKLPEEESGVITDSAKVVATLNSLCIEMDNRYKLLSMAGMRGIKEYNQKFISRRLNPEKGHRYLPYLVVIIDEFADLMLTVGKEVESPISRIAAKARAVGIHLILATQRPSVNVITGVIKANFPGRMAFRVTQMNDSRTILDRPGAEQLVGRGDMLISRDGIIDRVQCALIETDEVEAICHSISEQQGYPTAYELPDSLEADAAGMASGASLTDRDPMFAEAGRAVINKGDGSVSMLQRKLNIGFPRAGKLMDQLEIAGVVGPATAAGKPRQVLMDMYSFERYLDGTLGTDTAPKP